MRALIALVPLLLCGCALCRTHEVACGAVAATAATSIALSLGSGQKHARVTRHQSPCQPQGVTPC